MFEGRWANEEPRKEKVTQWPLTTSPLFLLSSYKKNTVHEIIRKSDFKYWLIT